VAYEPRVEELLANIRLAIDSDIDELDRTLPSSTAARSAGSLTRGSIREMHVTYDQPKRDADESINALRDRVGRQKISNKVSVQETVPPPKPAVRANPKIDGIGGILSGEVAKPPRIQPPLLRASYIDDEPELAPASEPYYEPAPVAHTWVEEAPAPYYEPQQAYHQPPQQQALMSPQAAYSAQSSFQNLTDNIMARALGETDIEGMTRDMLRPMLKNWLDENLPPLVEQLVREEIERVARRGR
jgi:uncharacterized protein